MGQLWVGCEGGRMSGDVASLATELTPYMPVAVSACRSTVPASGTGEAADAKAGLGRRLLPGVFVSLSAGESLPGPLADLAADPNDGDALAALWLEVRKKLAGHRASADSAPGQQHQAQANQAYRQAA